jgi:hypothetical protein
MTRPLPSTYFPQYPSFLTPYNIAMENASLNKQSEAGSSVRIVAGYGLDDLATEVPSPAEVKGFFL